METTIEGIFACGNVVHVHDLVDFVTEESRRAGKSAARYVQKALVSEGKQFETKPLEGVSYIVPHSVRIDNVEQNLDLFLRVRKVYDKAKLIIKADGEVIKEIKKRHLAPGEMEHILLPKSLLEGKTFDDLTIEVGEES
jgi:hypothetical protein